MVWDEQAFHGNISESNWIGHPVRHKVQQLLPDGNS
jgi:hypothetical protein